MDLIYDKEKKEMTGNIDQDVLIINDLFKSFTLPVESTKELITSLEDIEDPYKGNSDFLYYIIDKLINRELEIPKLSTTTTKLIELFDSKDVSFNDYAALIRLEPFIVAKLLKLANSVFYRGVHEVESIEMAIGRLGMKKLKEIIMVLSFENIIFKTDKGKALVLESWKSSIYTAITSQAIMKLSYDKDISAETIYTTSLLKSIGEFIILGILDSYLQTSEGAPVPSDSFVYRLINAFKYKISAIVLKEWQFSPAVYKTILNLEKGLAHLTTKQERIIFFADKISFLFYKNRLEVLNQSAFYEGLMDLTGMTDLTFEQLIKAKESIDAEAESLFSIF